MTDDQPDGDRRRVLAILAGLSGILLGGMHWFSDLTAAMTSNLSGPKSRYTHNGADRDPDTDPQEEATDSEAPVTLYNSTITVMEQLPDHPGQIDVSLTAVFESVRERGQEEEATEESAALAQAETTTTTTTPTRTTTTTTDETTPTTTSTTVEPPTGNVLRLINSTASTFDPIAATDTASGTVIQNVFDGLMNYADEEDREVNVVLRLFRSTDDGEESEEIEVIDFELDPFADDPEDVEARLSFNAAPGQYRLESCVDDICLDHRLLHVDSGDEEEEEEAG